MEANIHKDPKARTMGRSRGLIRSLAATVVVLSTAAAVSACGDMNTRQRDTALGAGAGGLAGYALGGGVLGTVGGAAAGGVIGNAVGK